MTSISSLYSLKLQIIIKHLHFSCMEDILIKNLWAVGKCNIVVCEASCWHKKITIRLLALSSRTPNKFILIICLILKRMSAIKLILSSPGGGGGGSEARMTKLIAANRKPLTL